MTKNGSGEGEGGAERKGTKGELNPLEEDHGRSRLLPFWEEEIDEREDSKIRGKENLHEGIIPNELKITEQVKPVPQGKLSNDFGNHRKTPKYNEEYMEKDLRNQNEQIKVGEKHHGPDDRCANQIRKERMKEQRR
ncbi:hypothetical protein J437_LFUL006886 [Ladona fulva]|uniref:Uncharacterized protein n=1 Tax=Ladona fulva TaxID=123851 RepID=A0A8K0KKD6_LADFU|nr:hypothetical protein J437_LFUL006886 [Ladona fulva]